MALAWGTGCSVTGMCRLTTVVCVCIWQSRHAWKCSLAWPRIIPCSASWEFSDKVDFSWGKKGHLSSLKCFTQICQFWGASDKAHTGITGNEPGLLPLKSLHCSRVGACGVPSSGASCSLGARGVKVTPTVLIALELSGTRGITTGNLLQDFPVLVPAQGGPCITVGRPHRGARYLLC